jgi:hypothetical protein
MAEWIPKWLAKRYADMYIVRREFSLIEPVEMWNVIYFSYSTRGRPIANKRTYFSKFRPKFLLPWHFQTLDFL